MAKKLIEMLFLFKKRLLPILHSYSWLFMQLLLAIYTVNPGYLYNYSWLFIRLLLSIYTVTPGYLYSYSWLFIQLLLAIYIGN